MDVKDIVIVIFGVMASACAGGVVALFGRVRQLEIELTAEMRANKHKFATMDRQISGLITDIKDLEDSSRPKDKDR